MENFKLFINNEWREAEGRKTLETINPANGEKLATIASASAKDVDDAVKAARTAFESGAWSRLDGDRRADYMFRVADILRKRSKEIAEWETKENGKPIRETVNIDVPLSIRAVEYFANMAREIKGEVIPIPGDSVFDYVTFEPYGVVGIIPPWNYPLHLATRGCCPALAAGNTVVLKPSSATSVSSLIMAEAFLEAGIPKGVFNIVTGPGDVTGEVILAHPDINMVSFTGSTEVGKRCVEASVKNNRFKKVLLELGGKGPFIACPDCDIDAAVNSLVVGFCQNQGEVCCASTRLFLHEAIYDVFVEELIRGTNSVKIGDPMDPSTQMGSLISKAVLDKVNSYLKIGKEEGARLLCGGEQYMEPPCDKGFFYKPTIFDNVTNDMRIAREEIFGPVLVVIKYKNLDEAIKMANDSDYGLGAAVFSNDLRTLIRAARELDAGTVWMNHNLASQIEAPYGGNKNSGIGRENGTIGLKEYLKVKNHILYIGKEYENYYGFKD